MLRWRNFLGLLLLLPLASCGYRLCNPCVDGDHGIRTITIQSQDPSSPLVEFLMASLEQQGVRIVWQQDLADMRYVVLSESRQQRLLAVANGNEPAEYELIYTAEVRADPKELNLKTGTSRFALAAKKQYQARRAQVFNETAVLPVELEADSLYREMAQEVATKVVRTSLNVRARTNAAESAKP